MKRNQRNQFQGCKLMVIYSCHKIGRDFRYQKKGVCLYESHALPWGLGGIPGFCRCLRSNFPGVWRAGDLYL